MILSTFVLIFIASLFISEWGAVNSPIGNFYLLPSRAWELIAGGLAAMFYLNQHVVKIKSIFSKYLSCLGLLFILTSYFLFTSSTLHPTSLTLLPVVGTVFVLLFAEQSNFVGKLLSVRLFGMIGLLSYSLYLWHQPVFAIMKKNYSTHLQSVEIFSSVVLIVFLSYLTWKYVEGPFRERKINFDKKILKYSFFSIVIFSLYGLLLKENIHIQKLLYPEKIARFEMLLEANDSHLNQVMFDDSQCRFWSKDFSEEFVNRFDSCSRKYKSAVFILGGSHGMDLYNAIAKNSSNPFIVSVSRGYCRAHKFMGDKRNLPKCQYEDFEVFADKYAKNISYLLYTQTPDRLFKINKLDNASFTDFSTDRLGEVTNYLAGVKEKYSLDVVMIGMLPPLKIAPIAWDYSRPFQPQLDNVVSQNSIDLTFLVDDLFASELQKNQIPYISKFEAFSLSLPKDLIINGGITYSDSRHISQKGEKIFGQRLVEYMVDKGYSL